MKQFVWLNPVSIAMYGGLELQSRLRERGLEPVECRLDHVTAVRQKYRQAVQSTSGCVADMRCPLAAQYVKQQYHPDWLEFPPIEPILLHCARELQQTLAGKGQLLVTTPCQSLKELGASLCLPDTEFLTFLELAKREGIPLQPKPLKESPIPPGFFGELGSMVKVLDSKEKIDRYFTGQLPKGQEKLLELLYCEAGCHRGDGIREGQ